MELIRISDSKLKVMLNAQDMAHYAITCEAINYENTETRRAIWEILDEAKQRTGFDAASDRIFIQVYPSREGGCELYITKLGGVCAASLSSPARECYGLYRFAHLADLLRVCHILRCSDYYGTSAAYTVGEEYYLCLRELAPGADGLHRHLFIEEFGERLRGEVSLAYIEEHGIPLVREDAVGKLADLC